MFLGNGHVLDLLIEGGGFHDPPTDFACACQSNRIECRDAVARIRVVEENFWAGMARSGDPQQQAGEGVRISAKLAQQGHAIGVGRRFCAATIAVLKNGFCCEHHRPAADEIAEQHAHQQRQAGRLQHGPRSIAVCDVADLVMPSKLTGMFASARAVVAMAHPGTELYEAVSGRGVVIPPECVEALTDAITMLVRHPALRARFGEEGRLFAQERLSPQSVFARLEERLKSLIGDTADTRISDAADISIVRIAERAPILPQVEKIE